MRNPKDRLLSDLLEDARAARRQERLRTIVLAEFGRAQRRRRWRPLLALAAVGVALLTLRHRWFTPTRPEAPAVRQAAEAKKTPAPPARNETATPHNLSDEELVASFPPNSCFLAEVDGRKVLVFTDPEVRKQYLH